MTEPELVVKECGEVGDGHDQEGWHVDGHDLRCKGSTQLDAYGDTLKYGVYTMIEYHFKRILRYGIGVSLTVSESMYKNHTFFFDHYCQKFQYLMTNHFITDYLSTADSSHSHS